MQPTEDLCKTKRSPMLHPPQDVLAHAGTGNLRFKALGFGVCALDFEPQEGEAWQQNGYSTQNHGRRLRLGEGLGKDRHYTDTPSSR